MRFITRRCEHVMEDGHRCNRPFTPDLPRQSNQKHCEKHIGSGDGYPSVLVSSTNAYAKAGNDKAMHEWVKTQMNKEAAEKERMLQLERKVERLEEIVNNVDYMKKKHRKNVKRVVRGEMRSNFFNDIVEGVVVRRLQKSFGGRK